jgi:methionyl-tRNA formyltransferase
MADLRVRLDAFEGPLDLLLHLVHEAEVDVSELPLAQIADQFLAHVQAGIGTIDVDRAGEFLVMASQLLVWKSRSLLPRDVPPDEDDIDPRLDLVKQLLAYKRFKEVAGVLEARAKEQEGRFGVHAAAPEGEVREEELEVDLYGLVAAFQRLLRETGDDKTVAMARERLPITHFVGLIFERLMSHGGTMAFRDLLGGAPDRTYVIGAFLALLELIKLRKVRVVQDKEFGDIALRLHEAALAPEGTLDRDLAASALEAEVPKARTGPRIVFMGSSEFAVPALRSLVGASMAPVLVVTPPDRPSGRGKRVAAVPLADAANEMGLPLLKSADVNTRDARDEIGSATPDVVVTAAFGQKLGGAILSLPPKGCVNLHASLLPAYRGASPVAAAIRDGATETGVTLFVMDEELDRGPLLAQASTPVEPDETVEQLTARLGEIAADLVVRALPGYIAGDVVPVEQDHARASYVPRLSKEEGAVSFARPAARVRDHVRSVTPWPGAATAWHSPSGREPVPIVLHRVTVLEGEAAPAGTEPGTVLRATKEGIDVACGEGVVRVLRLQVPGGKPLGVREFLNGRPVLPGDRFAPAKE